MTELSFLSELFFYGKNRAFSLATVQKKINSSFPTTFVPFYSHCV